MNRADGKRVRGLPYFDIIIPHIMEKRYDASNYLTWEIPYSPIREYIRAKRKNGVRLSQMSVVLAAYVRILKEHPEFNRFVVNKRIYQRNHICVSFVVLRDGGDEMNRETVAKVYFSGNENIFEISDKIENAVKESRNPYVANNIDNILNIIFSFGLISSFVVKLIKFTDRHNLLPRAVIDASPFHTSLFITNMASINMGSIYHHLYEFGTTTVFAAMGGRRKVPVEQPGGGVEWESVIPLNISTDERICSGNVYTKGFMAFKKYLAKPELLE
jgi:hypothetical protein